VPKSTKYLLIGSTEAYSGKSATVLGLSHQLQQKRIRYRLRETAVSVSVSPGCQADVEFVAKMLNLPQNRILPTLYFWMKQASKDA